MGRHIYTPEVWAKVEELRAQGRSWAVIAERLGVPQRSLEVSFSKWRRGRYSAAQAAARVRTQRVIALAEAGVPTGLIAQQVGRSVQAVCVRLKYHGLDAEVRDLYREAA